MGASSGDNFGYVATDYSYIPISGSYSSVPFPDNYQPTPKPDSNFEYDYEYYSEKISSGTRDIERIRQMIKSQQPGTISALADHWVKVVQLLDTVKKTVAANADALHGGDSNGFGGWSSAAADEFLRWGPGATLYSLQQWMDSAQANVRALRKLADAVWQAHIDIDLAWQNYIDESNASRSKLMEGWGYDPSLLTKDQQKDLPGPAANLMTQIYNAQTAIWRKWSVKAQGIAYELSQKYYAQLESDLAAGRGTRFEGPSNAVVDNPLTKQFNPPGGSPAPAPSAPPPAAPPPAAPPPAAPPPAAPPPMTTPTSPPPAIQDLTDLADQAQQQALAPPPAPIPSQVVAPLPLGALALSPETANLLGLAPPAPASGPAGLFGTRPGAIGATGTDAPAGNPGVLRSSANAMARAGQVPPGGMGRALSRANPNRTAPGNAAGRRTTGRDVGDARTNRPGAVEEPFEGRTGATSPSVLGGRRTTGVPEEPPMRGPGAVRPGTTPSVVGRSGTRRADAAETTDEAARATTTGPVLSSPGVARLRGGSTPTAEEAPALRGKRGSAGPTQAGPSELSSRRRARTDSRRVDDADVVATGTDEPAVVGDEAWSVPTPGGSVLTSRGETPAYEAEVRPVLGGGGN
jgi:hypothetical protein